MRRCLVLLLTWIAIASVPARSQNQAQNQVNVYAGVTRDSFLISSSFTGTEIVVFGGIESKSGGVLSSADGIDLAILVIGPPVDFTVRRKELVGGLWLNRSVERFAKLPGFYYIATTRQIGDIASPELAGQRRIGLTTIGTQASDSVRPYRDAIIDAKTAKKLYRESVGGIDIITGSIFRATIPLPAEVPTGDYTIRVFAFRDKQLVGAHTIPFGIDKEGLESFLSRMAREQAWGYALAAIAIALLSGWIASLVFRDRR